MDNLFLESIKYVLMFFPLYIYKSIFMIYDTFSIELFQNTESRRQNSNFDKFISTTLLPSFIKYALKADMNSGNHEKYMEYQSDAAKAIYAYYLTCVFIDSANSHPFLNPLCRSELRVINYGNKENIPRPINAASSVLQYRQRDA